jgi:hypothetical protein
MTTWVPKAQQSETWTATVQETRVFDPAVFDNNPIFDTGSPAGLWAARSEQPETWTEA